MFTTPESSIDELEELRELNSPLVAFFADSVRAGPDERCHSRELYDAYRQWAMTEGLFVVSHSEFTRTVRQMEANLRIKYKRNLRVGGANRAGFIGCAPRNASATQQAFGG
jgi:phage/plasmid-associated DNA primase